MPILNLVYALIPIVAFSAPKKAEALFPTESERAALRAALVELEKPESSNLPQILTLNRRRNGAASSFQLASTPPQAETLNPGEVLGGGKSRAARFDIVGWEDLGCGSIKYETRERHPNGEPVDDSRVMEVIDHTLRRCTDIDQRNLWEVSVVDDRGEKNWVGNPRRVP